MKYTSIHVPSSSCQLSISEGDASRSRNQWFKLSLIYIFLAFILTGCNYKFKINYDIKSGAPTIKMQKDIKVALVLGGGGAKCIAHLGVLSVLEKHNIPIHLIVGTSGGSIVGALYADNPNASQLKKEYFSFKQADLISFSLLSALDGARSTRASIINGANGERFLQENLRAKTFDKLQIPFIAVATDVVKGETLGLDSGPIPPAVRASYSIPGLFAPVMLYGKTLVDGGVTAPLGIDIAKKYDPEIIIAVDVSSGVREGNVSNMLELTYRSLSITYYTLNNLIAKQADILIRPNVKDIGLFDDHKREELYKAGVEAATKALPEIKRKLRELERKK